MSAVESDLNVTDDNRVDDDDDDEDGWLYGDCIEENAEERTADSVTETLDPSDTHDNGVKTQETDKDGDTTSDDDDDDDVCVTIGDIKTGGLSQSLIFGSTPVTLNIKGEGRTHAAVSSKCKGLDVDPVGIAIEVESFDEKPWRRPGSDISDYFNYGFNEETWRVYCEKQRRLHASNDSASRASAKLAVQRGRPDHGDKGSHSEDPTSSGSLLYRKSSGSIGVIGGLNGPISRSSGSRHHGNEVNTIQVLSETRSDGDRSANQAAAFFPPSVPPPPLLSPPPNVSSAPPLIIPPPRYPPPPLIPSLDSGRPGGYSGPPPPPYPFTPGLYAPPPGGVASWSGAMDSAKAWEHYVRRDRERKGDKGRDRSRERLSHSKDRERGRDMPNRPATSPKSEVIPDYSTPNKSLIPGEEERVRHRERAQRSAERHRNSGSRDRVEDDTRRDGRRRDKDEGRHKTSHRSSRRRRDDSEEDDDLRRRRKKAQRSRERSTDQENQTEDNQ